jgi:hypothetical protein
MTNNINKLPVQSSWQIKKIKIIRTPDMERCDPPLIPPFGLSVITSYLREKGFDIEQDDLNVKCFSPLCRHNLLGIRKHLVKLLEDRKRVLNYLRGGRDDEFHEISEQIVSRTNLEGFDTILISVYPMDDCSAIISLFISKYIKEKFHALIVIGGENNQYSPIGDMFELFHQVGLFDYYIHGPGEDSLHQLFTSLQNGYSLTGVKGLIYKENEVVRRNDYVQYFRTKTVIPKFEGLPLDLYEWKPDDMLKELIDRKLSRAPTKPVKIPGGITMLPFQLTTICPNRCAFCEQSALNPTKLSLLEPTQAVEYLKHFSEQYNIKHFFLMDNIINISQKRINEFCDEIINSRLDITWSSCAYTNNIDKEILIKMKEAGAVRLIFGLETASPRLLKFIGKTVIPEQVAEVFRWAHEAGIWAGIEIIAGLPTETDNDIEATIDFLKQNHRYIDEAYLNAFFLDRNSLMYKYPQRYNIEHICIRSDRTFIAPASYFLAMNRFVSFQFDETHGLKWKDKCRQIEDSYQRILKVLTDLRMFVLEENKGVSPLFYLYSIFQDKGVIKEIYFDWLFKKRYKRIFGMENVLRSIEEIRSQRNLKDGISVIKRKAFTAGKFFTTLLKK